MNEIIKQEDIIGKKGKCQDCGKEGKWRLEPYEYEIHDQEYLICLCDDCDQRRSEDI